MRISWYFPQLLEGLWKTSLFLPRSHAISVERANRTRSQDSLLEQTCLIFMTRPSNSSPICRKLPLKTVQVPGGVGRGQLINSFYDVFFSNLSVPLRGQVSPSPVTFPYNAQMQPLSTQKHHNTPSPLPPVKTAQCCGSGHDQGARANTSVIILTLLGVHVQKWEMGQQPEDCCR